MKNRKIGVVDEGVTSPQNLQKKIGLLTGTPARAYAQGLVKTHAGESLAAQKNAERYAAPPYIELVYSAGLSIETPDAHSPLVVESSACQAVDIWVLCKKRGNVL